MRLLTYVPLIALVLSAFDCAALDWQGRSIAELRSRGMSIVEDILRSTSETDRNSDQFQRTLDAVCAQRDCVTTHLFWYRDLNEAKREAKRLGRPIVSLRMLGNLDEELSCANSRFFRTILYPDPAVNRLLREKFVLHWSSERPVPKVTIDFGNGKTLQTTVVGNSIHYILTPDGVPLDALPGLYTPAQFAKHLAPWAEWLQQVGRYNEVEARRAVHTRALAMIERQERFFASLPDRSAHGGNPDSRTVAQIQRFLAAAKFDGTRTKSGVEMPLVSALTRTAEAKPGVSKTLLKDSIEGLGAFTWERLAEIYVAPDFSPEVWSSIERKHGRGLDSEARRKLRQLVLVDSLRNEFVLHREIHRWLAERLDGVSVMRLNREVFGKLFLARTEDPYAGLFDPEAYSGIAQAYLAPNTAERAINEKKLAVR